jgi:hypothetical protein
LIHTALTSHSPAAIERRSTIAAIIAESAKSSTEFDWPRLKVLPIGASTIATQAVESL